MADRDSPCEDDVPPLEDMSDLLEQVNQMKHSTSIQQNVITDNKGSPTALPDPTHVQESPNKTSKMSTKDSFGGFKKGFLFGSSEKKKVNGSKEPELQTDNIPLIKPKDPGAEDTKYKFSEVQDAMKLGQSFVQNKEWVTVDLLKQVEKSDILMKKMNDPRFMQAMQEFQTNPGAALAKYGQDKDVEAFLKEFCSILGTHFNNFADAKNEQAGTTMPNTSGIVTSDPDGADITVRSSTNPKQVTSDDEKKIQEILSDPEMKEILLDVRIQKLLETLRTDPGKAQRVLQEGGADIQIKIKKLVDAGVLGFQR